MPLFAALARLVGATSHRATQALQPVPPQPQPPHPPQLTAATNATATGSAVMPVDARPEIPNGLTVAAGYAVRLLILGAFGYATFWLLSYFSAVTVPVVMAILIAAMLYPVVSRLRAWGWHPAFAAGLSLLGMVLLVVGALTAVGAQVVAESPELADKTLAGTEQLLGWLASGPLHIDQAQLLAWLAQGREWVQNSIAQLASYAASVGAAFGNFFAGLATALVVGFFLAYQGRSIFKACAGLLIPSRYRAQADGAALRGWASLVAYMRSAVVVAAVDAAGVAAFAFFLNVPLVAALFALTFFASFIPIVGAVAAGFVAVLLALVTQGPVAALIMLGGVIAVMQLEGNFLQPFLMGKAVDIHPVGVLLGLTAGTVVAGILGALLSIPVMAFSVAFVRALRDPAGMPIEPSPPGSGDGQGRGRLTKSESVA